MPKPYKKAGGYWWIWVLCLLGGMAVMFLIAASTPESAGGWLLLYTSLPIVAAIIIAAIIDRRLTNGRRLRMGKFLQSLGLNFINSPEPEAKAAFFEPIKHLERNAGLSSGATNLQWIAYGPIGGRQALIFEHEFVTGSGKYTQVHNATAVCWVSNAGWLTLIRPRVGEDRAYERQHPEIHVEDEAFDKNWSIWGESEAANRMLSDTLRAKLSDSPRGEMWCFGGGWACCIYRHALNEPNLIKFIQRSGDIVHGSQTL